MSVFHFGHLTKERNGACNEEQEGHCSSNHIGNFSVFALTVFESINHNFRKDLIFSLEEHQYIEDSLLNVRLQGACDQSSSKKSLKANNYVQN